MPEHPFKKHLRGKPSPEKEPVFAVSPGIKDKKKRKKEETEEGKKPESAVDIPALKEQAIQSLFDHYEALKKQAEDEKTKDIEQGLAILEQAEACLARIEELQKNNNPNIDDLERIFEQHGKSQPESNMENTESTISASSPEGQEITFNLAERLAHWKDFYQQEGVDWITMPDEITVTPEQKQEMERLIRDFGFNWLLIIPENLVGTPEIETAPDGTKTLKTPASHYVELHQQMSQGYQDTWTSDNYQNDGGFGGSQDQTTKLRIILTKEVQNLEDDPLFKQTLNLSLDDLEKSDSPLKKNNLIGFSESAYLIAQRDYNKRINKHLDEKGWTWLPESSRPLSGRRPYGSWFPADGQLHFSSLTSGYHLGFRGCRPAGSFEVAS